jgi:hypothetical protein
VHYSGSGLGKHFVESVGVTVEQVVLMRDTPVVTAQRERVTTSDIA